MEAWFSSDKKLKKTENCNFMAEHKLFVKQLPSRRVKIVCFYHIEHVYLAYTYTLACHVLIETVEFIFKNKSVIYSDFTF